MVKLAPEGKLGVAPASASVPVAPEVQGRLQLGFIYVGLYRNIPGGTEEAIQAGERVEGRLLNIVHGPLVIQGKARFGRDEFCVKVTGGDGNGFGLYARKLIFELLHGGSAIHGGDVHAVDGNGARNLVLVCRDIPGISNTRDQDKADKYTERDEPAFSTVFSFCLFHALKVNGFSGIFPSPVRPRVQRRPVER